MALIGQGEIQRLFAPVGSLNRDSTLQVPLKYRYLTGSPREVTRPFPTQFLVCLFL